MPAAAEAGHPLFYTVKEFSPRDPQERRGAAHGQPRRSGRVPGAAKETELDQAFASGRIEDASLHRILADIGRLQGELRYTHLKYHLAMRLLSADQIAAYDRLRGYDSAQAPAPGMHGRHSH